MHGEKSHRTIAAYRAAHPTGKILLALTGTDIYPDPSPETLQSMEWADGLIVLQEKAHDKIPPEFRPKTFVVIQSARSSSERKAGRTGFFEVCVIGHFRDVKNPLLTAAAVRLLPAESRIHIRHAGGILETKYEALVDREQRENPRYRWCGELSSEAVGNLLGSSDLMALTSRSEGGARVVGEAIVHGTPVISSRIDGVAGILGDDYPGFFPDNDASALAAMLWKAESDSDFYGTLRDSAASLAHRFSPETEAEALAAAVAGTCQTNPSVPRN
jgi:glycosyltransferase involved in cell wall biosynthesis